MGRSHFFWMLFWAFLPSLKRLKFLRMIFEWWKTGSFSGFLQTIQLYFSRYVYEISIVSEGRLQLLLL